MSFFCFYLRGILNVIFLLKCGDTGSWDEDLFLRGLALGKPEQQDFFLFNKGRNGTNKFKRKRENKQPTIESLATKTL